MNRKACKFSFKIEDSFGKNKALANIIARLFYYISFQAFVSVLSFNEFK